MTTTLSSYDLSHIVGELQPLVGAKIEKIFQQEKPKDDFLLSLHVPGVGKKYIFISLPSIVCESSFKPSFPKLPPQFCSSLRRKISGARIQSITQRGFERIIEIELSFKDRKSVLVIELFSTGNIILVDESLTILAVLHPKIWSEERKVLPNKTYVFPQEQTNPKALSTTQLQDLLLQSDKESIVKTLAIDCSLGGLYAEEVVLRSQLNKTIPVKELSQKDLDHLIDTLISFFNEKTSPSQDKEDPYPIMLQSKKTTPCDVSFNELVSTHVLSDLEVREEKEQRKEQKEAVSKSQKILKKQTFQLKGLQKSEKENQRKGELLYEQYIQVDEFLKQIQTLKKHHSYKEIKEKVKDHPLFVSLDEKNQQITIQLNDEQN